ncbi:N-acetylmuramoyl-L-alanine amidase [Lentisphaerota bacterium WC36G]|nr:N-acetylmuramoyl-L-alanine amidase [Lentisphaerae bacterium WC36]
MNIIFKKKITVLAVIMLIITGIIFNVSAVFKFNPKPAYGKRYLSLSQIATYYGMQYSQGPTIGTLRSNYSLLTFTHKKKLFKFNGRKVNLLMPVAKFGTSLAISEDDFKKLIDPILRPIAVNAHKVYTIVIDPGHGGKDNGAGKGIYEKNVNLQIARRAKKHLSSLGYRVLMTRSGDQYLSLSARNAYCERNKGDLFISIHANAASASVRGIETFILVPAGYKSSNGGSRARYNTGNKCDNNNALLGYEIHNEILKSTNGIERSMKHAQFAVLKKSKVPAVLIETGFLSNYKDKKLLASAWYQEKIALGIAKGVLSYHQRMYKAWKK